MRTDEELTFRLTEARQRLRKTWLLWGVAPLAALALLTLLFAAGMTDMFTRTPRTAEIAFQAVLAVAAALFLVAFSLDGRWTDARRLAARVHNSASAGANGPTKQQLAARAPIAFESVYNSAAALSAVGVAIGLTGLVASVAGLGTNRSMILVAMAGCFQVFVLSRHGYYMELLELALRGELSLHQDANHSDP